MLLNKLTNKKPIIIGGFYRTGSTLFRRILNSHSHIYCGPEVSFFKDLYGDYIDDALAHIRFFATLRTLPLQNQEILKIFGKAYIKSLTIITKKQNKRRWADKNPSNVLWLNDWHDLLNGKFIFLFIVRNPLDSLSSLIEAQFNKSVPMNFEAKVSLYEKFTQLGLAYYESHKQNSYILKYEDLVLEPEKTVRNFMSFIGEKFESTMLTNLNNNIKHGSGIEDPKINRQSHITNHSINRFRSDLTPYQLQHAIDKLGDLYKTLGYDLYEQISTSEQYNCPA